MALEHECGHRVVPLGNLENAPYRPLGEVWLDKDAINPRIVLQPI
jgi:hypothetical protein